MTHARSAADTMDGDRDTGSGGQHRLPVDAGAASPAVLLVVASPTAMEAAIAARLRTGGSTVTFGDDDTVTAADANAHSYAILTPSVASSGTAAPTRLSTSTRPVWVAKPYLLDNYGLTGPTALSDYGNVAVQALTVQAPAHPMAGGRTGTLTAFSAKQTIGWGVPAAAATTVTTTLVGTTARAAAFVITAGDRLATGQTAPGCRLTFPIGASTTAPTADYWAMFDATTTYAAGACAAGPPPPPPRTDPLVLMISVDGLNPDAIRNLGRSGAPTLHRIMDEGVSTLNARSTVESSQTLPNHSSMLTGRPATATGGHGVLFNEDNGSTIHATAGSYVASAFDVAHDNGIATSLYAGKAKLDFLDRSWNTVNGAPDMTGVDDGTDKIDSYTRSTGAANTSALLTRLRAGLDGFTLVHYADPDNVGHASGYMSQPYHDAVARVDGWIGQLLAAVASDPALAARTTVLVTSDHGGLGLSHADATAAVNHTVPLMAWGAGVARGVDIYALNPDRSDPGTAQPPYIEPLQPVRSGEAANLVTKLLGLGPVPGSRMNAQQALDLR